MQYQPDEPVCRKPLPPGSRRIHPDLTRSSMSVITADDIDDDGDNDDAEIDFDDLDDEDIAQQLSRESPPMRGGGPAHGQKQVPSASYGNRGGARPTRQRSVTSDSMGLTADIADYLADTDSGSESGGYGYQPSNRQEALPRSQSMRQGGYGSQAYQRSYSTRH